MDKQKFFTILVTLVAVLGVAAAIFKSMPVTKQETTARCIITIAGLQYNVTAFIPFHPGGPEKIKAYCGKDATEVFFRKHNDAAKQKLDTMKI